jgi:hypothetical protein
MALFLRILTFAFVAVLTVGSTSTVFAQATATSTPAPAGTATSTPAAPGCVVTPVGIHLELQNPQPGDTLLTGVEVVMNGVAFDSGSTSGAGISSVTAYLGARDAGGLFLGNAQLGQPNPTASAGSQFANAGFTLRTPAMPSGSGGRSIFVYAKSTVGNAEATLEVPVYLNVAPTPVKGQVPTAVVPTPPPCTPTPTATLVPTATATPFPPLVAATLPATATRAATPSPAATTAAPPAAPPAQPPAAAPPPAAAEPPAAAAPATAQTTAPRGGGIPSEIGLLVLALGTAVVGGGLALRRRERR